MRSSLRRTSARQSCKIRPRGTRFQVPLPMRIDHRIDQRPALTTSPAIGRMACLDILHLDHDHRTITTRASHIRPHCCQHPLTRIYRWADHYPLGRRRLFIPLSSRTGPEYRRRENYWRGKQGKECDMEKPISCAQHSLYRTDPLLSTHGASVLLRPFRDRDSTRYGVNLQQMSCASWMLLKQFHDHRFFFHLVD